MPESNNSPKKNTKSELSEISSINKFQGGKVEGPLSSESKYVVKTFFCSNMYRVQ